MCLAERHSVIRALMPTLVVPKISPTHQTSFILVSKRTTIHIMHGTRMNSWYRIEKCGSGPMQRSIALLRHCSRPSSYALCYPCFDTTALPTSCACYHGLEAYFNQSVGEKKRFLAEPCLLHPTFSCLLWDSRTIL